jgi:hypothetical protein
VAALVDGDDAGETTQPPRDEVPDPRVRGQAMQQYDGPSPATPIATVQA